MINSFEKMLFDRPAEFKRNNRLATVEEVHNEGLKIRIDGETAATSKLYSYNKSISFSVGDRVKVSKISGTYVVDYKV